MKIKIALLYFLFVGILQETFAQGIVQELTLDQKLNDIRFLFDELEKSYPYFEINKRVTGTDWLSNQKEYLKRIEETKTDKAFFVALTSILNDLNNGHTDTYPTIIYDYFYQAYSQILEEDDSYIPYVEELERTDSLRCTYWARINEEIRSETTESSEESQNVSEPMISLPNLSYAFNDSISVAILSIRSFSYDLIDEDAPHFGRFFFTSV